MSNSQVKVKQPFVRIDKRDGTTMKNKVIARAVAILLYMVLCFRELLVRAFVSHGRCVIL